MGKNAYHVYAKQIREGTCDPKPKSGRPQKLSEADKEVDMDVNEDFRGSLTFEELAVEFSTRRGFKISAPTVWTVSTNAMAGGPCEFGLAPRR